MSNNLLIREDGQYKIVESDNYNYFFNKKTGLFLRWGKDKNDDPIYAPMPEILDLEISAGKCMGKCPECYKCNGAVEETHNMSFSEFKNIFHKVAKTKFRVDFKNETPSVTGYIYGDERFDTKEDFISDIKSQFENSEDIKNIYIYNTGLLQQIAFGICDIGTNPDFFNMMKYCREFDVIPNYTCHALDMNKEYAKLTAKYCGAIAISVYNKQKAYNAVKMLADAGMKQINFHTIAHDKSYDKILSIIDDIKNDERLIDNINAVVLLKYKPKGNGVGKFKHLTDEQYKTIINHAETNNVGIGFDSCSAHSYLRIIKDDVNYDKKSMCAEPCESSCFSSYINHKGEFFACSFCENEGMWQDGINVLECENFEKEIWQNSKTKKFREILLKNKRKCPMFSLD